MGTIKAGENTSPDKIYNSLQADFGSDNVYTQINTSILAEEGKTGVNVYNFLQETSFSESPSRGSGRLFGVFQKEILNSNPKSQSFERDVNNAFQGAYLAYVEKETIKTKQV